MDFSKDGRSTLKVFIFQRVGWKTAAHGICKCPLCDRAQLWLFYLNIFGAPNAKMTPAHTFEAIKTYPVSLQEKQLLLGTAVGICIKNSSGGYLNNFLISQWSLCRAAAVCVGIQELASQEPPWHPQVHGQNWGSLSIPESCWKDTQPQRQPCR